MLQLLTIVLAIAFSVSIIPPQPPPDQSSSTSVGDLQTPGMVDPPANQGGGNNVDPPENQGGGNNSTS